MKIIYANEFILNMGLDYPTTCFYQFIFDENDSNYTKIIQYFYYAWTDIMNQVK